jgi:hypothetical protein
MSDGLLHFDLEQVKRKLLDAVADEHTVLHGHLNHMTGKTQIDWSAGTRELWKLWQRELRGFKAPPPEPTPTGYDAARDALALFQRAVEKLTDSSPSAPPPPPPAETTPYSSLLGYAAEELKGDERKAVEVLCANNGSLALADFALAMEWDCFNEPQWSSLQTRLNKKNKLQGQGWRLSRHDNRAILRSYESPTKK